MDRIQRALDLSRAQRPHTLNPPPEDSRLERTTLYREFGVVPVEFAARVPLNWKELRERRVIASDDPQPAGHAYRMLRTQVLQRARANGLSTVGVVSAVNGEGKTLTAINL